MKKYENPKNFMNFGGVLGHQKGKKHLKIALSAIFGPIGSSAVRTDFRRGKWMPNSEIPLVIESRKIDLSNKPIWNKFGEGEGLQI